MTYDKVIWSCFEGVYKKIIEGFLKTGYSFDYEKKTPTSLKIPYINITLCYKEGW